MRNCHDLVLPVKQIEDVLFVIQILEKRIIQPKDFPGSDAQLMLFTYTKSMFISRNVKGRIIIEFTDALVI